MVLRPSRDEFRALARSYTVVPVWQELVADLITPVAAFVRLCGADEAGFLLESVEHAERWSRWSFLGRRAAATLVARDRIVTVHGGTLPGGVRTAEGILAALEDVLAIYRSPPLAELPPLHGGLVGYLGYDVVREVERLVGEYQPSRLPSERKEALRRRMQEEAQRHGMAELPAAE
ncbi:MAG: hypothetical protein N2037_13050 [Acidimicrobiales bacterium]|nr:hypothetical protein [Acidimicrobiales bacterium]